MSEKLIRLSKYLSKILRHHPEIIGLELDKNGWVEVEELIAGIVKRGDTLFSYAMLEEIVRKDSKKRYEFSKDGLKIRAVQGHSVTVDVELVEMKPPDKLYHGTAATFLVNICKEGLLKGERLYVHLSPDIETAKKVGSRRGRHVILEIDAKSMFDDRKKFYRSKNGLWLIDKVESTYLKVCESDSELQ